jgi:hypothetical protein
MKEQLEYEHFKTLNKPFEQKSVEIYSAAKFTNHTFSRNIFFYRYGRQTKLKIASHGQRIFRTQNNPCYLLL